MQPAQARDMSGRRAHRQDTNMTFEVPVHDGSYADSTVHMANSKQGPLVEDCDSDAPVVFLCGSCKLPVGDSMSWAGSEEEQNQILLKRVSDNVLVGKETHFSASCKKELGCLLERPDHVMESHVSDRRFGACCPQGQGHNAAHRAKATTATGCKSLIVHLTCCGCSSLLGMVYISTPRKLDYIRSLFCLNVAAIESYVLGSSSQQVAAVSPKQQPLTLEYRQDVEKQLAEIKAVTLSMGQRLLVLEADVQSKSQV